jgi:hypothetical protein
LLDDLIRLELVRRAQRRESGVERYFVESTFDEAQDRLVLVSRPGESHSGHTPPATIIRSVHWTHAPVGDAALLAATPRHWLRVPLPGGEWDFAALRRLGALAPDEVDATVKAAVFAVPSRPTLTTMLARRPVFYASFGWFVARQFASNPALQRILRAYVAELPRGPRVPAKDFARDFAWAALLTDAVRRGSLGLRFDFDPVERTLTMQSVPSSAPRNGVSRSAEIDAALSIVWDHTAVGTTVESPAPKRNPPTLAVGSGGEYTFAALSALNLRRQDRPLSLLGKHLEGSPLQNGSEPAEPDPAR